MKNIFELNNIILNEDNKNKNNIVYLEKLEKRARNKLIKRYERPISFYDTKMINNILYNEKTHYVEIFKEYLIYEDYNEFLKQYYNESFLMKKLEKILNFYEKYSKIFPNYTVLEESKYLYKNIKRKQKMINQINENKKNEYNNDDISESKSYNKTIFNSRVINSIYNDSNTLTLHKTDSNFNNNKSIDSFINKISLYEKKIKEEKNRKKEKKEEKIFNNKNEEQIIYKRISNLLNSSNMNPTNSSFVKSKVNKDSKKNIIDNNINNANFNNKIMIKPKQKSFSNIVYKNKKICASMKHNNIIKKNNNINNFFYLNN